jgi:hypothetical protein
LSDPVAVPDLDCGLGRWYCTPPLDPPRFRALRTRLCLHFCKWDPQVGDVSTLTPFALALPADAWHQLAGLAERLTAEALAAERELLDRPDLLGDLGLPAAVRRVLASAEPPTPAAARVFRFDFHPTADGWRISEANSDVPGGYAEAGAFTRLLAEHFPGLVPAGDPAARLTEALLVGRDGPGPVALLSAPGYVEDQQVTAHLAARLRERGGAAHLAHPPHLRWEDGRAHFAGPGHRGPVAGVFRFLQGEWLARLPARLGWRFFFRGGRTPVCNPGSCLLTESKRFPLVWDRLATPLPTWRALLPPTRDPRGAFWRSDPGWLLKTAFCNTGDTVSGRHLSDARRWRQAAWDAWLRPGGWVAQRVFAAVPLPTPAGPLYPCLGVYTVNGRAAGVYGRLAPRPLIDFAARDVAVLFRDLAPEGPAGGQGGSL